MEEKAVKISGVELDWQDPTRVRYQAASVTLERAALTRPARQLPLRDENERLKDDQNGSLADSALLAERVYERDRVATRFLYDMVAPFSRRLDTLRRLGDDELHELFDAALNVWLAGPAPLQSYEEDGARNLLTFPEYIRRLMVAIHAGQRGTGEIER